MQTVLPKLDKDSIKRLARQLSPAYLLYYPGRKWLIEQYNGTFFYFPPDLGGELVEHPAFREADGSAKMVVADGILSVKDRYGVLYDPIATAKWGYNRPVKDADGKIDEETADKVVTFFTTNFGDNAFSPTMSIGLTMLTGDNVLDVAIKAQSKKLWLKSQSAWALQERSNRQEQLAKWKKENPGRADFPPMNPRQIEAEEVLLDTENIKLGSKFKFICEFGDYETDSEEKFEQHFSVRHPEQEIENVLTVKRGRGRPKKIVVSIPAQA